MKLEIITPARTLVFDGVVSLRFDAPDGARGVLPGHERARVVVEPGAIEIAIAEGRRVIGTEGGIAVIDPAVFRLVTPWAAGAGDFGELERLVAARSSWRATAEAEARAIAARHDMATRRALASLRRQVAT
jgi:F0F1-type ATP synthase epsilon subunit